MAVEKERTINWFAIWTSIAVAVVVIVGGGIVVGINNSPGPTPTSTATTAVAQGATINTETGAVSVGTGARQVDTYIDFMCPICNQFEQSYGPTLDAAVADGSITLNIHPIAILDRFSQGTEYSTRSASALYCVAESQPAAVQAFVAAMYAGQPAENTTGLTNDQIVAIATRAGAPGAGDCIRSERYRGFVTSKTKQTPVQPGKQGIATPTVAVDGEAIALTGDPAADILGGR